MQVSCNVYLLVHTCFLVRRTLKAAGTTSPWSMLWSCMWAPKLFHCCKPRGSAWAQSRPALTWTSFRTWRSTWIRKVSWTLCLYLLTVQIICCGVWTIKSWTMIKTNRDECIHPRLWRELTTHSVEFHPKSCILVLNNGGIGPKASLNSSFVIAGRAQVTSSITVRVRPAHGGR